jgi:hypothetical protein
MYPTALKTLKVRRTETKDGERPPRRNQLAKDELQESVRSNSREGVPLEVVPEDKVQHDLVSVEEVLIPVC